MCTVEYYLAIKGDELLINVKMYINFGNIMQSERSKKKSPHVVLCNYLCEMSRTGKSVDTERRSWLSLERAAGGRSQQGLLTAMGLFLH